MLSNKASAASPKVITLGRFRVAIGSSPLTSIWRASAARSRAFANETALREPRPISRRLPATFHMKTQDRRRRGRCSDRDLPHQNVGPVS